MLIPPLITVVCPYRCVPSIIANQRSGLSIVDSAVRYYYPDSMKPVKKVIVMPMDYIYESILHLTPLPAYALIKIYCYRIVFWMKM